MVHHFAKYQFSFTGRTPQDAWRDAEKFAKKEKKMEKLYRILIFGYLIRLIVERNASKKIKKEASKARKKWKP